MDDLKKLFTHLKGGKVSATAKTPSPLSTTVRDARLPIGYVNMTKDLRFHGNVDPVEFLGRFNIEMDVYQVLDLARCRLLAATFREGVQQWFQKIGPWVITSWEQMETLFLTKFQAAVKYAPPVTSLANIKQEEGESLQSYFKRFKWEHHPGNTFMEKTRQLLQISLLKLSRSRLWNNLWQITGRRMLKEILRGKLIRGRKCL